MNSRSHTSRWQATLLIAGYGFALTASLAAADPAVDNDACADALPVGDGVYTGTTTGATPDGTDSCDGSGAPDVWYLYTASCDGSLQVTISEQRYVTAVSVESPGCTGTEETCNAGGGVGWGYAALTVAVAMGEQKLVRVTGRDGESVDYTLHLSCHMSITNDTCVDATPVPVGSSVLGTTVGATPHDVTLAYQCPAPTNWPGAFSQTVKAVHLGVWHTTIGTGKRMIATTCNPGTNWPTAMRLYCNGCDRSICVGRNNDTMAGPDHELPQECATPPHPASDGASTIEWCSKEGQPYHILVMGFAGGQDYELSVVDTGMPCGDAKDCTPVEVAQAILSDNGDDDGWADPNETVRMRLKLHNRSRTDLTGVTARLASDDPRIACVADTAVPIGALPAGETIVTDEAFAFRVADVTRRDALQDFAGRLKLTLSSDQFQDHEGARCAFDGAPCAVDGDCTNEDVCEEMTCAVSGLPCRYYTDCGPNEDCEGTCSRTSARCFDGEVQATGTERIAGCEGPDVCVDEAREFRVDLAFDAEGGVGPTVFFEGFESGDFGHFTPMHLDLGRGSLEASDGYRCQIYNPDLPHSHVVDCALGGRLPDHADAFFWQVGDDRAYSGFESLNLGYELSSGERTTPLGTLEAVANEEPINIGWERTCSSSGQACTASGDCSPGELCLAATPELTFKHVADLVDGTHIGTCPVGNTVDRGVVQVQPVDSDGNPLGPWRNVAPYKNGYSHWTETWFLGCMFDPVDDGNDEDDVFAPDGPYGPSSTCYAQRSFSRVGDNNGPFNPMYSGTVEGPGLEGETGEGTWVESRVDLSPFRGQRIRVRFLYSSYGVGGTGQVTMWDDLLRNSPNDDGWWIDDVTVTDTLTLPATRFVDMKDNTALGMDADGDCFGNDADCAPADDRYWTTPGVVQQLRLAHSGGNGGATMLRWTPPQVQGGIDLGYVTLVRGSAFCDETDVGDMTTAVDAVTPAPGELHTFLVRAGNDCGPGSWGVDSAHVPRDGCP